MPKKPKISLGIPCYGPQHISLTVNVAGMVANMFNLGYEFGEVISVNVSNVDINRNKIVDRFKELDSDWLWWVDADNLPPIDSLPRLLGVGKPLVSGLYYGGIIGEDTRPVAYIRRPDGMYHSLDVIYKWERGEIVPVDAVGMGCFLTHKDVYFDIENNFTQVQARSGWKFTVKNDDIKGDLDLEDGKGHPYSEQIHKSTYYQPVKAVDTEGPFPHFQCQFNRTEDFVFCENAKALGYEILVDTSVEVGHLKTLNITGEDYRKEKGFSTKPIVEDTVHV